MQELVRRTQSFHSSTTTVVGTQTIIQNDSVLGDPLGREEKQRIMDYIATVNEDDGEHSQICKFECRSLYLLTDSLPLANVNSLGQSRDQANLGLDAVLAKRCLKLAIENFQQQKWSKTQEYLSKALTYESDEREIFKDVSAIKIALAHSCALQEKWGDLERVIVPGLKIAEEDEFLKLDLLSMLYFHKEDYTTALENCRAAVQLKWSIYGERHALAVFSIFMLVEICTAMGDASQADLWLDFIPSDSAERRPEPTASDDIFLTAMQPVLERVHMMSTEQVAKAVPDTHGGFMRAGSTSRLDFGSNELQDQMSTLAVNPAVEKGYLFQDQFDDHNAKSSNWPAQTAKSSLPAGLAPLDSTRNRTTSPAKGKEITHCIRTFKGQRHSAMSIAFSPNGQLVASGSRDNIVRLWDVSTGRPRRILEGHSDIVQTVAFSLNSRILASGSKDKTIRLWDVMTGNLKRVIKCNGRPVREVAFSPDGRFLASALNDNNIWLWDVKTGGLYLTLGSRASWVMSIAFSPNGFYLVAGSADGRIRLWETAKWTSCLTLQGYYNYSASEVAFSSDSQLLASRAGDNFIQVWDVANNFKKHRISDVEAGCNVAFSPDGCFVASASSGLTIKLWDAATGSEERCLRGHEKKVTSVAFSPDGGLLASASEDETIRLWEID